MENKLLLAPVEPHDDATGYSDMTRLRWWWEYEGHSAEVTINRSWSRRDLVAEQYAPTDNPRQTIHNEVMRQRGSFNHFREDILRNNSGEFHDFGDLY